MTAVVLSWRPPAAPGQARQASVATWRPAPEYLSLFAPAGPRQTAYRTFVSAARPRHAPPATRDRPRRCCDPPGAWQPKAAASRSTPSARRAATTAGSWPASTAPAGRGSPAGPAASDGRVTEAWTLISPYPDPALDAPRAGDPPDRPIIPSGAMPGSRLSTCLTRAVSSLTNRIFLACTLVAALSLGFAFSFVNERASREAEEELRRGLAEAGRLVDEHRATLTDTFTRLARLIGGPAQAEGRGRNRRPADGAAARRRVRSDR